MKQTGATPTLRFAGFGSGFEPKAPAGARCLVGAIPGEGIGPEVVGAALLVLDAAAKSTGASVDIRIGGNTANRVLSHEVSSFCESVFADGGAVLCGPVGGRFVYELRGRFDLYCKVVPIRPSPALADATIVRPELLRAVDLLIVRENVGGVYFGESGRRDDGRVAYQNFRYSADQVARIVQVAAGLARQRRRKLTVIVKNGGIPEVSALWREQALPHRGRARSRRRSPRRRQRRLPARSPSRSASTSSSRPTCSATCSPTRRACCSARAACRTRRTSGRRGARSTRPVTVRRTTSPDTDRANPVAQILTLAMMLRESFGLDASRPAGRSRGRDGCSPPASAPRTSRARTARWSAPSELAARIAEEASKPPAALHSRPVSGRGERTALLLVDLQKDFLERPGLTPDADAVADRAAELLRGFRARSLPIVHAHTVTRADGSDRMPHWKRQDTRTASTEDARSAAARAARAPTGRARLPQAVLQRLLGPAARRAGCASTRSRDSWSPACTCTPACARRRSTPTSAATRSPWRTTPSGRPSRCTAS